jgi:hypothetical protein
MSKSISQTEKDINKYINRILKYIKNNPNSEATKKIVETVKYIKSTPNPSEPINLPPYPHHLYPPITSSEHLLKPHTKLYDRPIPLGVSGGNKNDIVIYGTTLKCCGGTLGCLVTKNYKYYILSNFHVLSNDIKGKKSSVGDIIVQPAPLDYECEAPSNNAVAKLSEWEPISLSSTITLKSNKKQNYIDAAIAEIIENKVNTEGYIEGLGIIRNTPIEPRVGMRVVKSGRTTGITYGIIDGVDGNVIVKYDKECGSDKTYEALFEQQLIIKPDTTRNATFSSSGDSGSLVLTEDDLSPVGLIFSGNSSYTYANRINMVLERFGVSIVGSNQYHPILESKQPQTICNDINNNEYRKARDIKITYINNIMSNFPYFISSYVGMYNGKYKIIVMVDKDKHTYEITHLPRNICGVDIDFIEVDKFRPL